MQTHQALAQVISATNSFILPNRMPDTAISLQAYTFFLEEDSQLYSLPEVVHQHFLSPRNFHQTPWQNIHTHAFWMKLSIYNPGVQQDDLYWFLGYPDRVAFYALQDDGAYHLVQRAGLMEPGSGWKKWNQFAFPLHLPAGTTSTFYVHITNEYDIENPLFSQLFTRDSWNEYAVEQYRRFDSLGNWVFFAAGFLCIIAVLSIIGYLQTREASYLILSGFSIAQGLYFFAQLSHYPGQFSLFGFWPSLQYAFDIPGPLLSFYLPYMWLSKHVTAEQLNKLKIYSIWRYILIGICAIVLFQWISMALHNFHLARIIFVTFFYLSLLPAVAFLWWLGNYFTHTVIRIFLIGSWVLWFTALLAFHLGFISHQPLPSYGMQPLSLQILIIGSIISTTAFWVCVLRKLRSTQVAALLHEQQQIDQEQQLMRNLSHQVEELKDMLKQKDEALQQHIDELQHMRQKAMDTEYKLKLNELELKAIRAQMNPHFIFNCLNSIQLFIMQHREELAQEYLSDFSLLIRQTLEMSKINFVSLDEEIQYLQTYLRLEKMRFEDRMDYEIIVAPQLDIHKAELPTMLLQPYVENAVKHGINHPLHKGLISLRFEEQAESLICSVEDNGIGIKRTKAIGVNHFRYHLMAGMEMSKMRAEWINKLYQTDIRIEIIDKEEIYGDASGTIVRIHVPQV